MRKLMLLLAAVVAVFAATAAAAPGAGHGAMIARDHARAATVNCSPAYVISTKNGTRVYAGFDHDQVGHWIDTVGSLDARCFSVIVTSSTCPQHANCETVHLVSASSLRLVSTNCATSGKALEWENNNDQTGDTFYIWYGDPNGNTYIMSRYCLAGYSNWPADAIATTELPGAYWNFNNGSGHYSAVRLTGSP